MKCIIVVLVSFMTLSAFAQQISYKDWQEEATHNIRLLPEYGNIPKTDEMKKIDRDFIRESLLQEGTAHKASEHHIDLGFQYLYRRDLKTAMYRFNQAWLLEPKNEDVYWGFGAIYFAFNDYGNAFKMYDKGLALNPKSSKILTDKATVYLAMLNDKFDNDILNKAIDLFKKSYSIDPKDQNTTFKLSTLYFSINDCKNATKYYNECKMNGGQPITEEYTNALSEKCKKQ